MPFCVDLWRRNQMGAAPMPFAGRVLRQVPLDAHVVVYGEDGLSALTTGHASGIVGKAPVSGFSSRVGIASRGAACGSDDGHAFVDQFGTLWTLDGRLQAERVGFQKDLSRLVGPNMQMSLNPERREFHISTADECYVYGRDGFYRHKPVTSMAVLGGTLTGGLEDTAEVLPGPWGPSVVYVDKAATGEDDGTSWEDAFTTIMAGVVSASLSATESAPITVMVSEGEYSEAITLSPHVQLFGGFDKTETHPVQRGYQFTTMVPPDTTGWGTDTPAMSGLNANGVTIDGFRFVRPDTVTSAWDAAIRLVNSSGTVSRCEFLDLFQTAVDVPHRSSPNTSVVTVKNCVFARLNGAIQRQEAHVHVYNCTFWDTTVHVEADHDVARTLARIRELGCAAGIALNPDADPSAVIPHLHSVDLILCMTVFPGFGGQSFIPSVLETIRRVDQERAARKLTYRIEVDGGINAETSKLCRAAGADTLVAGTSFFKSADPTAAARALVG
jgi:hypothetical protein